MSKKLNLTEQDMKEFKLAVKLIEQGEGIMDKLKKKYKEIDGTVGRDIRNSAVNQKALELRKKAEAALKNSRAGQVASRVVRDVKDEYKQATGKDSGPLSKEKIMATGDRQARLAKDAAIGGGAVAGSAALIAAVALINKKRKQSKWRKNGCSDIANKKEKMACQQYVKSIKSKK